jgi:hypothetical protein
MEGATAVCFKYPVKAKLDTVSFRHDNHEGECAYREEEEGYEVEDLVALLVRWDGRRGKPQICGSYNDEAKANYN